ncbi:MAG: hypothetical protein U1E77_15925 [Inhella sp.]
MPLSLKLRESQSKWVLRPASSTARCCAR